MDRPRLARQPASTFLEVFDQRLSLALTLPAKTPASIILVGSLTMARLFRGHNRARRENRGGGEVRRYITG